MLAAFLAGKTRLSLLFSPRIARDAVDKFGATGFVKAGRGPGLKLNSDWSVFKITFQYLLNYLNYNNVWWLSWQNWLFRVISTTHLYILYYVKHIPEGWLSDFSFCSFWARCTTELWLGCPSCFRYDVYLDCYCLQRIVIGNHCIEYKFKLI